MKIVVTGTRGIPGIQGGVETHCSELYPRLVSMGYRVILTRRSCYITPENRITTYRGVELVDLFSVRHSAVEAFIHTLLSILWARKHEADVLHIHAIGPAIFVPFARLLGLKVVFTHHGPDYDRAKWGSVAKSVLRLGEKWGSKYASEVIVISDVIRKTLEKKFNRTNTNLIFNGFSAPVFSSSSEYLTRLGLTPRKYIFTLGRFVEEKGFDLLIRAFKSLDDDSCHLVIAGDADHESAYSRELKKLARLNNVVLTGFIKGAELQQLFSNARLFVLPSFHEGLPISLLEAMSYRLPVLVSDIPANMQIGLPNNCYFRTGDEESLKSGLSRLLSSAFSPEEYDMAPYDWSKIALQTARVYEKIISGNN